jgi:hypothetical protein
VDGRCERVFLFHYFLHLSKKTALGKGSHFAFDAALTVNRSELYHQSDLFFRRFIVGVQSRAFPCNSFRMRRLSGAARRRTERPKVRGNRAKECEARNEFWP